MRFFCNILVMEREPVRTSYRGDGGHQLMGVDRSRIYRREGYCQRLRVSTHFFAPKLVR